MTGPTVSEALAADGFNPPPYIGEEWIDDNATWLPEGHRSVITITALGRTMSGWQARVMRRQIDQDGNAVPSKDGRGIVYVQHLMNRDATFRYRRRDAV